MFRLSWALALIFSLAMLTGILIVTRDLAITNAIFKDGVVQAEKVNSTTDKAVDATGQLPPADEAIHQGLPQVVGVLGSLSKAETTLGTLGTQLSTLAGVLRSADPPLVGIISAASNANTQAGGAIPPATAINGLLRQADAKVRYFAPLLDQTSARASNIESRLHLLLVVPGTGGNLPRLRVHPGCGDSGPPGRVRAVPRGSGAARTRTRFTSAYLLRTSWQNGGETDQKQVVDS